MRQEVPRRGIDGQGRRADSRAVTGACTSLRTLFLGAAAVALAGCGDGGPQLGGPPIIEVLQDRYSGECIEVAQERPEPGVLTTTRTAVTCGNRLRKLGEQAYDGANDTGGGP